MDYSHARQVEVVASLEDGAPKPEEEHGDNIFSQTPCVYSVVAAICAQEKTRAATSGAKTDISKYSGVWFWFKNILSTILLKPG